MSMRAAPDGWHMVARTSPWLLVSLGMLIGCSGSRSLSNMRKGSLVALWNLSMPPFPILLCAGYLHVNRCYAWCANGLDGVLNGWRLPSAKLSKQVDGPSLRVVSSWCGWRRVCFVVSVICGWNYLMPWLWEGCRIRPNHGNGESDWHISCKQPRMALGASITKSFHWDA